MRGGKRGDGHEVSILIRLGDGEREERAPSNVSTMIIRPPQPDIDARAKVFRPRCPPRCASARARPRARRAIVGRARCCGLEPFRRRGRSGGCGGSRWAGRGGESGDELGGVERHGPEPVAAFDRAVLPFESHARLVEPDEPGIGDRDAVGVASEIGERGFRPGEGSLGVDDPLGAAQRRERGVESALVGERRRDRRRRPGGRPR